MKVSAGPYTLELPANGVAVLYEDGRQLPGGVGYLSALVEFAGEVMRLNAEIAALREIAARPSPELHALTKERDELRERCAASDERRAMSEMWLWEPTLLLRWRRAEKLVLEQLWRGRKVAEPLPLYALEEWREVPVVEDEGQ